MERARSISKSMMSYLKRARDYKEFLLKETKEFERGKRHLANMMGIESQEMNQEDVDKAIKYLFPSGLFDKRARPIMKHPELIYKAQKEAQFDPDGRPFHHLFYTVTPNYHSVLTQIGQVNRDLNKYEDEQFAKGILIAPDDSMFQMSGRQWLSYDEVCDKFLEKITQADYDYLIKCLDKLSQHSYSNRAAPFFQQFSNQLKGQSLILELPEIIKDEKTGEIYTEQTTRQREHDIHVKTILNGSGLIDIEGHDILFFKAPYHRKAIHYPLVLAGMQDKVDIIARFVRIPRVLGQSAVAGAIRYALSTSLAAFCNPETRERLRLAGLLAIDTRRKERKKFGQEGARRKYTWKKR